MKVYLSTTLKFQNFTFLIKPGKKYFNLVKLIFEIRKEKYDFVINVQRFASTGLITALSGSKSTIGFDKNPLSFLFSIKIKHSF